MGQDTIQPVPKTSRDQNLNPAVDSETSGMICEMTINVESHLRVLSQWLIKAFPYKGFSVQNLYIDGEVHLSASAAATQTHLTTSLLTHSPLESSIATP